MEGPVTIRPVEADDAPTVERVVRERWGAPVVAVHDTLYRPAELPGFMALSGQRVAGLVTYRIQDGACEIVTLDAITPHTGVGSALVEAVAAAAREAGCRTLWLVTTNDNLDALRFYLRRGFRLVDIHPGAVTRARRLKPSIPEVGAYNIPMQDELELERVL